jgi:hypothetical protein
MRSRLSPSEYQLPDQKPKREAADSSDNAKQDQSAHGHRHDALADALRQVAQRVGVHSGLTVHHARSRVPSGREAPMTMRRMLPAFLGSELINFPL